HGAMCYSYSGRCLFSSMLGGRSGNRGRCAQPCRLPYDVETSGAKPVSSARGKKDKNAFSDQYPLSMKDLCTLDLLPELTDAGIASFKIEGRMKSPQYTAGVTSIYRKYLDQYAQKGRDGYRVKEEDLRALLDLFDRGGFSHGYYTHNISAMVTLNRPRAKSAQIAWQKNENNRQFLKENSKVKINGVLRIYPNEPVILRVWTDSDQSVEVSGGIPDRARTAQATAEEVQRRMKKTGGTEFEFENLEVDLADGLFLPVSLLNELRRDCLQQLREKILSEKERRCPAGCSYDRASYDGIPYDRTRRTVDPSKRYTFLVTLPEQLDALLAFLKEDKHSTVSENTETVYLDSMLLGCGTSLADSCRLLAQKADSLRSRNIRCFFVCPPVLRVSGKAVLTDPNVCDLFSQLDGFLVSSIDELGFLKERYPDHLFASGESLYTCNREAQEFLRNEGITRLTLPAELNEKELYTVANADTEQILYGFQPLMQSAQCVRKNTSVCYRKEFCADGKKRGSAEPELIWLRDRKQIRFPVLTRCRFCTNTIYNSVPLRLFGCREQLKHLPVPFLRISFTIETGEETMRILKTAGCFAETISKRGLSESAVNRGRQTDTEGTRGHFKRGVE
ncbi:MAG: U32 family peptidase, partial [Lachnospiraceae bacterium]|nr:U32 family peptidase [Lachnospiraceae bacterium]